MESRSAVLGYQSEIRGNNGKIEHENGLNFDPRLKDKF